MKRLLVGLLLLMMIFPGTHRAVAQDTHAKTSHGFAKVKTEWIPSENANGSLYRHEGSGLRVFFLENGLKELAFSIGFITPPQNDRGANHVLEHALLCGSESYPARNLMHHLRNTSVASVINAATNDQTTSYYFRTGNETDYYNLLDVYMSAVFEPLILREKNIFLQQGIRWEADEKGVSPNGVVYNELRQNSLDTGASSVIAVLRALNGKLFSEDTPVYSSGGEILDLLDLTYKETLQVYADYYHPSNALIFISGALEKERVFLALDGYLQNNLDSRVDKARPFHLRNDENALSLSDEARKAAHVDVGLAFTGIPVGDARAVYARDAMLMALVDCLREEWPEVFMGSDSTSGYETFYIVVPGVPSERADTVAMEINAFLETELPTRIGTTAMAGAIDTYEYMIEDGNGWAMAATLKGFANGGDPFALLDKAGDFAYIRSSDDFMLDVWQTYIVDARYRVIVAVPQREESSVPERTFSELEIQRLMRDTEDFLAWVDEPETEEELASLPRLRVEDFAEQDAHYTVTTGETHGIRYWHEPGMSEREAVLGFAVPASTHDWLGLSLLARLMTDHSGMESATFAAYPDPQTPGYVLPRLFVGFSDDVLSLDEAAVHAVAQVTTPDWITVEALGSFIANEITTVQEYLRNPHMLTLEAMYSGLTPMNRFAGETLGLAGQGTEAYLHYLRSISEEALAPLTENLRALASSLADRQDMILYLRGDADALEPLIACVVKAVPRTEARSPASLKPEQGGIQSLLTITPQAESAVHYMQVGLFEGTAWSYSGQMDVMARVLQSGYLLPELRGKHGAYGTHVSAGEGVFSMGASGVSSIDQTYEVLAGVGNYLRNLSMTSEELEAIVVATVHAFDQRYDPAAYYAMDAELSGQGIPWIKAHRAEILCTTIDDVRAFAEFVEQMVGQQRIFAYTNEEGAGTDILFSKTIRISGE